MEPENTAAVQGTDSVHSETRTRDSSFVMAGHHCHHCFEMFYVRSGSCRFLINEEIHDVSPGRIILIPPMVLHYTRYLSGSCTRTVILFRQEDVEEDVLRCMPGPESFLSEAGVFEVPEEHRPRLEDWISRIEEVDRFPDVRSVLVRKYALQELLLFCSRVCSFSPGRPAEIRTSDRQVLSAARYICEHYMQPITSNDVARAVGFSPNYLSRKFRTAAGIGLHEYLVFIRLHHAAQELVSSPDSITDIALRCGFTDGNYFKDSFKKVYGVTPRFYRKIT